MYLTRDEYQSYFGVDYQSGNFDFTKAEKTTEMLFDIATNNFYVNNDIAKDTNTARVENFKRAMAMQIMYLYSNGASNTLELEKGDIKSITIDGTTIVSNTSIKDRSTGGISNMALNCLYQTGLLYEGVDVC